MAVRPERSRHWKVITVGTVFVLVGGLGVGAAAAREQVPTPGGGSPANPGNPASQAPSRADFVNIRDVARRAADPRPGRNASTGTFTARCGNNENAHHNPDNHIVAPGVRNGAQHVHDYVGNLTTDGNSTDASLQRGGTTCANNDKSAYFWPVLRIRNGQAGSDANAPGGGLDGNIGQILEPSRVNLQFRGNPIAKVRAMPQFLRTVTGDAKSVTNGDANVKAAWTCSGFTNRTTTKYPLCPRGSQVLRVLDFPSCWDGKNTDSANHRTHIVFPQSNGACASGFQAVPQLRMTLSYDVPRGPLFAVDSFPDQKHNPKTDHADFHNLMPTRLMNQVVSCLNSGRRC